MVPYLRCDLAAGVAERLSDTVADLLGAVGVVQAPDHRLRHGLSLQGEVAQLGLEPHPLTAGGGRGGRGRGRSDGGYSKTGTSAVTPPLNQHSCLS